MAALLCRRLAHARLVEAERAYFDRSLWPVVVGAGLGARLFFLLSHPHLWSQGLVWWRLSDGGMTSYGGLLGGLFGLYLYRKFNGLETLSFLDRIAPAVMFGWGVGRLGCFFTWYGEEGKPCSVPWGLTTPEGLFHPVQLYLISLLWLGAFTLARRSSRFTGELSSRALIWFGAARAFSDSFRTYDPPILQLASQGFCLVLILGAAAWIWSRERFLPDCVESKSIPEHEPPATLTKERGNGGLRT